VSYATDMGGMNSLPMDCLAKRIWEWFLERNIFISAMVVLMVLFKGFQSLSNN